MTAIGTIALSGIAFADNINDDINDSGTGLSVVAGSGIGATANIKVVSTSNNDGDPGCNIDSGEVLVLGFNTPTGVSVDGDPSTPQVDPLTITACDITYPVLVKAAAGAASGAVTAYISTNTTGAGRYNNNVNIPVTVTQPAPVNTAPKVAVTGVADQASYHKSQVPQPGCSVADAEDTGASTQPVITGGAYNDLGTHTVTCSYTDTGNLTGSATATYTVVRDTDTTAPVISYQLSPAQPDGQNGWYTGAVTLAWTVTEADSPETLATTGCDDQTITTDQAATTYTCAASSEGGTAAEQAVTIKRDATAPTVSYTSVAGTVGNDGWYTTPVTATFTGTDALSGPARPTQDVTSSSDGNSVTLDSPTFADNAGNTTPAGATHSPAFKVDTTAPTNITFAGLQDYYFGDAQAKPTCTAADATSGLAGCTVTGGGTSLGTQTWTATATDNAGNRSTATVSYQVKPWTTRGFYAPVDMSGIYNSVKGGSTVPLKFELFKGATELTDTSAATIKSFATQKVTCDSGAALDAIEELATTGSTSLRYDTTAGQYVQNWKTPTGAGTCYKATITAADGSAISALFKIK